MHAAPLSQTQLRQFFLAAVWIWIGINLVLSLVGLIFALGDSPVTGTTHVSLTQILWDSGTIVSPPLVFILAAGLLQWSATSGRLWLSRLGTGLLVVGIAIIAWDTHGGLNIKAIHYSSAKWDVVLALGWGFVLVSAVTVLVGATSLLLPATGRLATTHADS